MLRRGAIIAGAAWSVPVIQSINMSRAWAQVSPLEVCYTLKFEFDQTGQLVCDQVGPNDPCILAALANGCGQGVTVDTSSQFPNWVATLPSTCRFVSGGSKCDGPTTPCETAQDNGNGTVTFFPCPKPRGGVFDISHISFSICCT